MKINGIGTVATETAMEILTQEGRDAVKSGEITTEELGEMYKLHLVKKASRIGKNGDLFRTNYSRIPETVADKLSPEEVASLVDAFYQCYGDGKSAKEAE